MGHTLRYQVLRNAVVATMTAAVLLTLPVDAVAGFPGTNANITFASFDGERRYIFTMSADGSHLKAILATGGDPQWSPDGGSIVFTSEVDGRGFHTRIFIVREDGSGKRVLTPRHLSAFEPAWSPDGTKVVFTATSLNGSGGGDSDEDLYVINVNGSGLTQLTSSPDLDYMPAWSPDGKRIVFSRSHPLASTTDLYVISPDGSDLEQLTDSLVGDDYAPAWSPSGRHIVFERYDGYTTENSDLYVITTGGANERRITSTPWHEVWPSFSPDGKKILFGSDKDGDYDIYTIGRDRRHLTKLTHNTTSEQIADWQRR